MQHKCKVTVLKKELFKDLQEKYLANPQSGVCPFYKEGQEFLFERYGDKDDFWTEGNGTHCAEAWDCISRYIYTADICAKELEEYYITKYGNKVFAIYGMSMGGILASYIWKNKNIEIEKLILESSPLLSWNEFMTNYFTKWYLNITHKTQNRDERTIKQAIGTIISEDKVDVFLELFDHLSDKTIINCVQEVGKFNLPSDINTPNTEIYYFYGSKINEILFRKVAHYLKKNYQNTTTICLKGKYHCEDALINPEEHIKTLNKVLKK